MECSLLVQGLSRGKVRHQETPPQPTCIDVHAYELSPTRVRNEYSREAVQVSGEVDQSAGMLDEEVKDKGYALLCVSEPTSDCTIRTIEEVLNVLLLPPSLLCSHTSSSALIPLGLPCAAARGTTPLRNHNGDEGRASGDRCLKRCIGVSARSLGVCSKLADRTFDYCKALGCLIMASCRPHAICCAQLKSSISTPLLDQCKWPKLCACAGRASG